MKIKLKGEFSFYDLVNITDEIRGGLSHTSDYLVGHPHFL